jgi:hypothetical protein
MNSQMLITFAFFALLFIVDIKDVSADVSHLGDKITTVLQIKSISDWRLRKQPKSAKYQDLFRSKKFLESKLNFSWLSRKSAGSNALKAIVKWVSLLK